MANKLDKPKDYDAENLKVAFEPSPTATTDWHPDQQILLDGTSQLNAAISVLKRPKNG